MCVYKHRKDLLVLVLIIDSLSIAQKVTDFFFEGKKKRAFLELRQKMPHIVQNV